MVAALTNAAEDDAPLVAETSGGEPEPVSQV